MIPSLKRLGLAAGVAMAALRAVAAAAEPTTSDLVHIGSGGTARFEPATAHPFKTSEGLLVGAVVWSARSQVGSSVPVVLSSRGQHPVLFFEPAPLRDLPFSTLDDLRRELGLTATDKLLPPTDPAGLAPAVSSLRPMVRDFMAALGLKDVDALASVARCQQQVPVALLSSSEGIGQLLACADRFKNEVVDRQSLVKQLSARGMLRPELRSLARSGALHAVGYVVAGADLCSAGAATEIWAAAGEARAEKILSVQPSELKGWWQTDAAKLFIPPLFTLVGLVLGAFLGFRYFLRQQDELKWRKDTEEFHERKLEKRVELKAFFDDYPTLAKDANVTPGDILNRLNALEIYGILLPASAAELNRVCAVEGADRVKTMHAFEAVLRRDFGEYMTRSGGQ